MAPLLSEDSEPMVEQIMCQPNNQARAQAWDNWILNGQKPQKASSCNTPSQEIINSLKGLRSAEGDTYHSISPTLVFSNNIAFPGAIPAYGLEEMIELMR